jgi:tRNA(fMet)-specific endonuclease VapC
MRRYLLDTNTVSDVLKAHPQVLARLTAQAIGSVAISVITEAELRFGLAKRPQARGLHHAVEALLQRLEILPWTRDCAPVYGELRARLMQRGKPLAALDLLIAAQALATDRILVSRDQDFLRVPQLLHEDWSAA